MNMGRFYGRIVDSMSNKSIEAASVQLIVNKFDSATKKKKRCSHRWTTYKRKWEF